MQKKKVGVHLVVEPEEKDYLEGLARHNKMTVSEVVIAIVNQWRRSVCIELYEELIPIIRELRERNNCSHQEIVNRLLHEHLALYSSNELGKELERFKLK